MPSQYGNGSDASASDGLSVRFLFFFLYRRYIHTTHFGQSEDCSPNNASPGCWKAEKSKRFNKFSWIWSPKVSSATLKACFLPLLQNDNRRVYDLHWEPRIISWPQKVFQNLDHCKTVKLSMQISLAWEIAAETFMTYFKKESGYFLLTGALVLTLLRQEKEKDSWFILRVAPSRMSSPGKERCNESNDSNLNCLGNSWI